MLGTRPMRLVRILRRWMMNTSMWLRLSENIIRIRLSVYLGVTRRYYMILKYSACQLIYGTIRYRLIYHIKPNMNRAAPGCSCPAYGTHACNVHVFIGIRTFPMATMLGFDVQRTHTPSSARALMDKQQHRRQCITAYVCVRSGQLAVGCDSCARADKLLVQKLSDSI